MSSEAVEDVWQRQSLWSQSAGQAKKAVNRSFTLVLGLVVAAAVLGASSAHADRQAERRPLPTVSG